MLENSQSQEHEEFVSIKYGAICLAVATYKELLKRESRSSKESLLKNQKAINLLTEIENKMYAKVNGPFHEISESIIFGFEAFSKKDFDS
jgi:hypothetical protein